MPRLVTAGGQPFHSLSSMALSLTEFSTGLPVADHYLGMSTAHTLQLCLGITAVGSEKEQGYVKLRTEG